MKTILNAKEMRNELNSRAAAIAADMLPVVIDLIKSNAQYHDIVNIYQYTFGYRDIYQAMGEGSSLLDFKDNYYLLAKNALKRKLIDLGYKVTEGYDHISVQF